MKKAIIAGLILVVFYNFFFYQIDIGVGVGLFFLILNIIFFASRDQESKNTTLGIISSIFSVLFGFLVGFRSNEILLILNILAALFFASNAIFLYKDQTIFPFLIFKFLTAPIRVVIESTRSLSSLLKGDKSFSDSPFSKTTISAILRGAFITIPLFLVLLFLLILADPVFAKYATDLISDLGERLVFSVVIFWGIFFQLIMQIKSKFSLKDSESKSQRSVELIIISGTLSLLFAFFIAIQLRYLFTNFGERELHKLGIQSLTYSEYVKKGFFELLIAATIASSVIVYALKHVHRLVGKNKLIVQVLTGILTTEIGLLLLSAAQRINLYYASHGLTRARIFGLLFLINLAVILIIFLIKIFKDYNRRWFFSASVLSVILVLLLSNIINIDGLIATKYKPTVNKEIDYYYLASLSIDGYQSWQEALQDADVTLSSLEKIKDYSAENNRRLYYTQNTLHLLKYKTDFLNHKYGPYEKVYEEYKVLNQSSSENRKIPDEVLISRKWQSFNLSEYQAYEAVLKNSEFTLKLNKLLDRAAKISARVPQNIRNNTPLDRVTEPPLTR